MRQLPDISIRQLEYLVAVADSPTWADAASSVGVSASALSQGMAELERRLELSLFEPEGRRRVLRDAATPVLDHARRVVSLTGDLAQWARRVNDVGIGRVRLGMVDVAAVDHYPDELTRFRLDHPNVDLKLTVAPSAALLHQLRGGAVDLVVCVEPSEMPPGLDATRLRIEPINVYAPAGTNFGESRRWGPWLLFPDGSISRAQIMQHLRRLGAPMTVAAESHQATVLRQMAVMGFGWTALPTASEVDDGLVRGPTLFERQLVLVRRAGSIVDPAVERLQQRLFAAGELN